MTVPPPKVLAMVVCDQVHEDPSTGKDTILGTFDRVASPSFPYTHPAVTSFMQVTNGRGDVEMLLRLVDADEAREPLFEVSEVVKFGDPTMVGTMIVSMRNVVFPEPGMYRLQLLGGGELIVERSILASQTQVPEPTD